MPRRSVQNGLVVLVHQGPSENEKNDLHHFFQFMIPYKCHPPSIFAILCFANANRCIYKKHTLAQKPEYVSTLHISNVISLLREQKSKASYGRTTRSITWITPLLAGISTAMMLAVRPFASVRTPPLWKRKPRSRVRMRLEARTSAESRLPRTT